MLYRPRKERQWDSWIVYQRNLYFMFYINVSENGTRWDGISLATSQDLLHWEEYGRVLEKHEKAIWLGTGMVHKVKDYYIMNYSLEMPEGFQRIYFAKSYDLYHWDKVEGVICEPDPGIYMTLPSETCDSFPRWDSLGIFEALSGKEPPYYAFCSSNLKGAKLVEKAGVLGLLTSDDGLHWKSLPPAYQNPEDFPSFEVPEYVAINGRHYALFCTSSYLGYRNDSRAEFASGGTYYVVSDSKLGPYRLPKADPMLQGTRDHYMVGMNYVGRVLQADNQLLYYHIWGDPNANAWMGLIKRLSEKEPYQLQLTYFEQNEVLKNHVLLSGVKSEHLHPVKKVGVIPPIAWNDQNGDLFFENNGSSSCLLLDELTGVKETDSYTDLRDGRVFECDLEIDGFGAGIYFHTVDNQMACIFLNRKKQRVEFGYIVNGWGANMILMKDIYKPAAIQAKNSVKLFARQVFLELYIGTTYIAGWRIKESINPNQIGFYAEDASGSFQKIRLWDMK